MAGQQQPPIRDANRHATPDAIRDEAPRRWHVTSVGETMGAFLRASTEQRPGAGPDDGPDDRQDGRLDDVWCRTFVGAESNVLIPLAQLGYHTRWCSRLGDDELGRYVRAAIEATGVVADVEIDDQRSTGLALREPTEHGSAVRYYRTSSAASALHRGHRPSLDDTAWVHLTGATPALSASCRELVLEIADAAAGFGTKLSVDVNIRPALWASDDECRDVLTQLCRRADIVFIGHDEAELLTGSTAVETTARVLGLGEEQDLVLKRGPQGATLFAGGREQFEASFSVPAIVDVIGAGDAFAAGYLAATLAGYDGRQRLRTGNYLASRAIQSTTDIGPPPSWAEIEAILSSPNGRDDLHPRDDLHAREVPQP